MQAFAKANPITNVVDALRALCLDGPTATPVLLSLAWIAVLAEGAARALAYPLGYATIGLVLSLRRPANPIGWLYATAGLAWSLSIPVDPWLSRLVGEHRPLPLAAQAAAVYGELNWAPATVLGGHPAGGRWRPPAWPRPPWCWWATAWPRRGWRTSRSPTRSGWPGPLAPSPA